MQRRTIQTNYLETIDWFENTVIDWNSAGTQYLTNGETRQLHKFHFGFNCDSSITSIDGNYVFLFQKLGTKGLLIKNGELVKEINRSYYQSSVYEFPAAFFTFKSRTYLIHCPIEYCRLDIEDVETGELITNKISRKPPDIFHSRLEVSYDNRYLLSKGWVWQPLDVVEVFDLEKCLSDPTLLDKGLSIPNTTCEICSASFIDNKRILVCASREEPMDSENKEPVPPGHLAIWNIELNKISPAVKINGEFGNVFSIDDTRCWDLFKYPKIIDLNSGKIVDRCEEVDSGNQSSSIIHHLNDLPKIAFNRDTKQVAISKGNIIEVLTA